MSTHVGRSVRPHLYGEALAVNRACYSTVARGYETSGAERAVQARRWLRPFLEALGDPHGQTLLEWGPADGVLTGELGRLGFAVTAVEYSPVMSRIASANAPHARVVQGDFLYAPAETQTYDAIIAMAVVHLIPPPFDLVAVLRVRRLLSEGGLAFLATTVESKYSTGFEQKDDSGLRRYRTRYRQVDFQALIQQSGLVVAHYYETADRLQPHKTWGNWIVAKGAS